jgi:hypothetical protein
MGMPSGAVDLTYAPKSYFGPQGLQEYLISKVKGAIVREKLKALLRSGRHSELALLLSGNGISDDEVKKLESLHPAFMGGNYLPDTESREVEIARIEINSTTHDVTSVFASRDNGCFRYRVVDEYEGDTLTGDSEMSSINPLTLGELVDFFLSAWSLVDVLKMNFDTEFRSALSFFKATSNFYPDFESACIQYVTDAS